MHQNGCQQAFSGCSIIRALSLVTGWHASHSTELQFCQVSHSTCKASNTYPFLKCQTLHALGKVKSLSNLIGYWETEMFNCSSKIT